MIVATDKNGAIGKNGDQLIYISDDLKHFKAITSGHTVVMGRKTSEALPKGILPNRRNIILTRSTTWEQEGAEIVHIDIDVLAITNSDEQVYVIGGGEIYKLFMPFAQRLFVTEIDMIAESPDTYFPPINSNDWKIVNTSDWLVDEKSNVRFRYVDYERIYHE